MQIKYSLLNYENDAVDHNLKGMKSPGSNRTALHFVPIDNRDLTLNLQI